MNTVTVRASKQYDILIGQGLLPTLGAEAKSWEKRRKFASSVRLPSILFMALLPRKA